MEDLHDYAARVAGTVGAMMALVMETRDPRSLARACELGVAMQLTNIARDVGEDARNGRLYLPLAWMREAGLDPEAWLAAPQFVQRLARVVSRLLAEADACTHAANAASAACRATAGRPSKPRAWCMPRSATRSKRRGSTPCTAARSSAAAASWRC